MTNKKNILITGANAGIGFIIAKLAAGQGHKVILACRNSQKAEQARLEIQSTTPDADVEIHLLDLASIASIRAFASNIEKSIDGIDVLINNAGIFPLQEEYTQDGFEIQFGVNYLGHFLLTHLLLPVLSQHEAARIINVSSIGHLMGRIKPGHFRGRKNYLWGVPAYAQSKLANVLFSNEMAQRIPKHITSNAVHPGYVDSEFFRNIPAPIYYLLRRFLIAPEFSGKFILEMALSDDWKNRTGEFVSAQGPLPLSPKLKDTELRSKLYRESCELVGVEAITPPQDAG